MHGPALHSNCWPEGSIFFSHGKQFIQLLIDNLSERLPEDAPSVMSILHVILNPQPAAAQSCG